MFAKYNNALKSWLPKPEPILDEDSIDWLFDVYVWAQSEFSKYSSILEPELVLPNNQFFPGRENSLDAMAELIFNQVLKYSKIQGMQFQIVPQADFQPLDRASLAHADVHLPIPYDPQLVANPEALIASFSHNIAQYLVMRAQQQPPGGVENFVMVSEVVSVFLGFGVMLANSGFNHRGGCGSCSGSMATRESALSQFDLTYALAIFCLVHDIDKNKARGGLKSALRGYFKKSLKALADESRVSKIS